MLDALCNRESGAVFALCSLRHPDAGVGQKGAFCKGLSLLITNQGQPNLIL